MQYNTTGNFEPVNEDDFSEIMSIVEVESVNGFKILEKSV